MVGLRTLLGISVFWLALSLVSDGLTTLMLPAVLPRLTGETGQATVLGLVTFAGLVVGMLIQPVAGTWSDRLRSRLGRRGVLAMGALALLAALALFGLAGGVLGAVFGLSWLVRRLLRSAS